VTSDAKIMWWAIGGIVLYTIIAAYGLFRGN
jgi:hypothetical protein